MPPAKPVDGTRADPGGPPARRGRGPERIALVDLARTLSIALVMASHFGLARLATGVNTVREFLSFPAWNLFARNGLYGSRCSS